MDLALTAPANTETVRVWLRENGSISLAQAVQTANGGGARAEAVRQTMAKHGCDLRDLTNAH